MEFLLTNQETERLRFRKLEITDFEIWKELFYDDEVTKFLGMSEFRTPKERCEKWFEWTFQRYDNNLGGQNVLISKIDQQIVGQSGLLVREIEGNFEIEVAYSILPKFRNKGFASEAAKKCRDFAFQNDFNDRLISLILAENVNSKNVASKNGMKYMREIEFHHQRMDLFEINKTDWKIEH